MADTDASRLRRVGDPVRKVARSHVELADAIAGAREHGHTWTQIAAMLGTSRQAGQERYGELGERPQRDPSTEMPREIAGIPWAVLAKDVIPRMDLSTVPVRGQ